MKSHVSQEEMEQLAELRAAILESPGLVLDDPTIMRALTSAPVSGQSSNIVDLRTVALDRLEHRLTQLEETHRSVVAAAYENLAGMNQVHRAILQMLEPETFEAFLHNLGGEVADILRVDSLRLVLETIQGNSEDSVVQRLSDVLCVAGPGFCENYLSAGNGSTRRSVVLRQIQPENDVIYGDKSADIRSEAVLLLDLGEGRLPGLLVMGSEDPHHFRPSHGTDLLSFFASVFERSMRRWLT